MPKYLWKASYTTKGARGVAEEGGSGRRDAVSATAAAVSLSGRSAST